MKTLQIRLSDELRNEADEVLEAIGIDMSTAIRVYLKKIVQDRGIPFKLEACGGLAVSTVAVDAVTQRKMDGIASAWKSTRD